MTILHAQQMPFDEPLRQVNRARRVTLQHPTKRRRIHISEKESAFVRALELCGYVRVGTSAAGRSDRAGGEGG